LLFAEKVVFSEGPLENYTNTKDYTIIICMQVIRDVYIYTRKVLRYITKIIIYCKEELVAKCVRLYYGDLRSAV
jgi:hypothetical protein